MKSFHVWRGCQCLLVWLLLTAVQFAGVAAQDTSPRDGATVSGIINSLSAAHRQVAAPLDLDEVIARVGSDPKALTDWIRASIAYEPYSGVMKGAVGVLISQRANSADKALLLYQLLQRSGYNAELIRGEWGPTSPPAATLPPMPSDQPDDKQIAEFAKLTNLSPQTIQAMWQTSAPEREQFQEQLWGRTIRDRDQLASLLTDANVPAPALPKTPVEATRWWVRTGNGVFDPTTDSAPAADVGTVVDPEKIAEADFHRITIRMIITSVAGETVTVLEVPFKTCDVFGKLISVGATSAQAKAKIQTIARPDARAYFDALEAASEFQPSLMIFGSAGTPPRAIPGTAFDISGKTIANAGGRTGAAQKVGGAMGGMFGGLSGEEAPAEKPKEPLKDAWLEIELSSPGATSPVKIRRDILTHATGAKASRQLVLDLVAIREIVILPEELSGDYVTRLMLANSAAWAGYLDVHPKKNFDARQMFSALADRPHLNEKLLNFAVARRAALARLCAGSFAAQLGVTAYVHDHPTLVSHVSRLVDDDKGPRVARRIDILENSVTPVGKGATASWQNEFGLLCGAMDTALEHVLLWGTANASAALDQTRFADASPIVISGKLPENLQLDPATKAAVEPDLSNAAFIYIAGAKPMWYRVSLHDGTTLGMVQGGGGQEESEYAEVVEIMLQLREMIQFYGELGRCLGEAISAPLAGEPDAHKVLEECFVGICSMAPSAVAGAVGVEPSWTNIIICQTINHTFKEFCKGLWERMGPGGHGEGH